MQRVLFGRGLPVTAALVIALMLSSTPVAAASTGYRLPWVGGVSYVVGQPWCGTVSHDPGGVCLNAYDFAMPSGTIVVAAMTGTVADLHSGTTGGECNPNTTYQANYVKINHGNGTQSWYYHLSAVRVKKGDIVVQGQIIGLSGSTGYACGPHLHFQLSSGSAVYYFLEYPNTRLVNNGRYTSQNYETQLSATRTSTRVVLNWTDSSTYNPSFVIQRQNSSGAAWATVATFTGPTTTRTYTDTVSASITTYQYRVGAQSSAGTVWSPVVKPYTCTSAC
jgi:murein DD-endopeptidase MepM/ murein hydrolase activator NlpD